MVKDKRIIKLLLTLMMALVLALQALTINTNIVSAGNAQDGYDVDIMHGYGRGSSYPSQDMKLISSSFSQGEYKYYGKTAAGGYTGQATSGYNAYRQKPQGDITSIDFYYEDQMITLNQVVSSGTHCIKAVVYLTNGVLGAINAANITSSSFPSGSTKLVHIYAGAAGDAKDLFSRWYNVIGDVKWVMHYSNELTLTVNGVTNTSVNDDIDTYFTNYDLANNKTETIVSGSYSSVSGIVQSFELEEGQLGSVSVGVGNNGANLTTLSGVQYLSSSYSFSSTHNSSDILAIDFDNKQIIYYVVNSDISISFNYVSEVTYDVTFMVGDEQYGEVQTVYENGLAIRPTDPEIPSGYDIFKGWYLNDVQFDFSSAINSDITLDAVFEKEHTISIINSGHAYSSSAGTLLNASYVSCSKWTSSTGGSLDTHNCIGRTVGDYENETGFQLNTYTNLANLDYFKITFGNREPLTVSLASLRGNNYYVNENYELVNRGSLTTPSSGDIYRLYVSSSTSNAIQMFFYKIVEDIKFECVYNNAHTIQILNFGNETHDYIGNGKFAASGASYSFYTWDPYGATYGTKSELRNGGTIDHHSGIATIYGDYSSSNGYGAALLVHDDLDAHDVVVIEYKGYKEIYPLVRGQATNEVFEIDGTNILRYVHNSNEEYYNLRFFNIDNDIVIRSSNSALESDSGHRVAINNAGQSNGGVAVLSEEWASATGGAYSSSGILNTADDFEDSEGVLVRAYTSIGKLKSVTINTNEYEYTFTKNNLQSNVDLCIDSDNDEVDNYRFVWETGNKYFDLYFYQINDDVNVDIEYDDVTMTFDDIYGSAISFSINSYPTGTDVSDLDASFTVNSALLKDDNTNSIQISSVPNTSKMDGLVISDGTNEFIFYAQSTPNDYTFGKLKFAYTNGAYYIRFLYLNTDITIYPHVIETISASQQLVLNADGTTSLNLSLTTSPSVDTSEGFLRINGKDISLALLNHKIDYLDNNVYTYRIDNVSAKNMTDEFSVQFFKNNDEAFNNTNNISVKNYLTTINNGNYDNNLKAFAKSMLSFGAYAQNYFRHDINNLDTDAFDQEAIDSVVVDSDNNPSIIGETIGISAYGQSLTLKYYTDFRVVFKLDGTYPINNYKFMDGDKALSPIRISDDTYYVKVGNLAAPDLANKHTIVVTNNNEGSLTVTTSALAYANMIINDPDEDIKLINCMKAMYDYYNKSAVLKVDRTSAVSKFDDVTPYNGEKIKVAFVGDSITYGYLSTDPSTKSYPAVLSSLFNGRYEIGNYGVSASYAIAADDPYNYRSDSPHKSYKNTSRFSKSIEFEPDIVVIMLGGNDTRSIVDYGQNGENAYREAMSDLISIYKSLPSVSKVYLATAILSTGSNASIEAFRDGPMAELQKDIATNEGVEVIDTYALTRSIFLGFPEELYKSGHPTDAGYQLMAEALYDYLTE